MHPTKEEDLKAWFGNQCPRRWFENSWVLQRKNTTD